jgi:hypothetical protein
MQAEMQENEIEKRIEEKIIASSNPPKPRKRPRIKYFSFGGGSSVGWSCNACDGDSNTGCLFHDPSECPRHT